MREEEAFKGRVVEVLAEKDERLVGGLGKRENGIARDEGMEDGEMG
jgi:hypothetical protein